MTNEQEREEVQSKKKLRNKLQVQDTELDQFKREYYSNKSKKAKSKKLG